MLKGLLLSSGGLTYYIIYGKWIGENNETENVNTSSLLGYSILNIFWLLCILFAITLFPYAQTNVIEIIFCWIIIIIYPTFILLARRKFFKENINKDNCKSHKIKKVIKEPQLNSNILQNTKSFHNFKFKKLKLQKKGKIIFLFLLISVVAIFLFVESGIWRDLKYQYALYNYEHKSYVSSTESFKKLGHYKESNFYYYDSIYKYSKQLIDDSKYRQASAQLNIISKNNHDNDYDDFSLLRDQCDYYLNDVEKKFNDKDYDNVISLLANNNYDKAVELYSEALKQKASLEEKRIINLYKEKKYGDAFLAWYDSDYKISKKYQNKIINKICEELISVYKNNAIDFYGHLEENKLCDLEYEYWTPKYKKWVKSYKHYYDYVYDYY